MKRFITIGAAALAAVAIAVPLATAAGGFDQFGYNRTARIFNGPASGWCLQRGEPADCLGVSSNDRLTMKWNAEWDRGNAEGWTNPPYAAWENNEWNGNVPGGSGWTEHFKTVWDEGCAATVGQNPQTPSRADSRCIWDQFAVLMDHGSAPDHSHEWWTKANPVGYGTD